MARNFTADCMLVPLPCGCCSDVGEIYVWAPEHEEMLERPWCDTTFARDDFKEWLSSEFSPSLLIQHPPRNLLRYAGKVLEAMGWCDCNEPLVREPGGKKFHLDELPKSRPEIVRN